jgi:hypothetical protein
MAHAGPEDRDLPEAEQPAPEDAMEEAQADAAKEREEEGGYQ